MAGESSICRIEESVGLTDRISNLPDEVREYILGFLLIKEAVRTSVLSKKWRYSWTKMVQLNLYFSDDTENRMYANRYFRLVGRILLFHVGPVHKCVLQPLWHDDKGDINVWLQLLSRKGITDLTIKFKNPEFKIPPSIFQCLGLQSLTLESCSLENSIAFKGFPHLFSLDLNYVDVYDDILEKVIANSPLEMLFVTCLCFYSSQSESLRPRTAIDAPNLTVLHMWCLGSSLKDCYLKNTPNLREASFFIESGGTPKYLESNCYDVLRSMPKVEELAFDCRLHKTSASDIIPNKLPEVLRDLKTVDLDRMDVLSVDHLSFMFCIIRSSPNLQSLNIEMSENEDMKNVRYGSQCPTKKAAIARSFKAATAYLEVEAKEEIKASIQQVSIYFDSWNHAKLIEAEIALIDRIVSCCPALEKLVINGTYYFQGSEKLQLSRALRRYGQSSSKLKIINTNSL